MQYANMNGQGIYTDHFHKRIHCRSGHIAVEYRGHMLVWAGFMSTQLQEHPGGQQSEYLNTDELMVYNSFTEVWNRILTSGDVPQKNSGSCGVMLDDCLYIFGGFQESRENWNLDVNVNHLYRLDLRTLVWKKLNPTGIKPLPCDKLVGWTYKGKLYFFGGFGPAPEHPLDIPFLFASSADDAQVRGWNNQLLCYDPDTNEWSWPRTRGTAPSPRAAHAADISENMLYVFGGRLRDTRMSSLHCLNMDTMEWSPNLTSPEEISPEGRSWHSLTFINKDTAILYGGFSQQSMILSDCWQLRLPRHKWERMNVLQIPEPRLWHQAVYLPSQRTLAIAGGHITSVFAPANEREHADNLLKLNFEPKSLLRLCLNTAVENFKETSSEWGSLPVLLQNILRSRLEQI